jgi:tripartite-type tricarboxylate transporter receptor subunit TctC
MNRKKALTALLATAMLGLSIQPAAFAQEKFPTRPIQLVVPFPPGGVADIVARAMSPALEKGLGQSVANAKPDGYTLLMALASISTNPEQELLNKRPSPFQLNQLTPIARISMEEMMLAVRADSKYHSVTDVVNDARKRPGAVSYSSSGIYGVYHVAMNMFADAANIKMNHIPYGGGAPALLALLSGEVDVALVTRSVGAAHLKSGKLRPLAAWGSEKWSDYPQVPTLKAEGYDVDYQLWSGMFAPAGTPPEVLSALRSAVKTAVQDPQFKTTLAKQGAAIAYMDAPEFQRYWDADAQRLIAAMQKIGTSN